MKVFYVSKDGICETPPPRPGTATLTVGRESVTLDPLMPRDEFDRCSVKWQELADRAFGKLGHG